MPFDPREAPQVPMSPFPQRILNDPIAQRLTMHSVYNSLRNATARTTAPVMGTGDVPYLSDPDQQEKINNLLAPFGARLPQPDEIKQNFLLPEAGTDNFFGAHPNLTRGIEGALLSAANTPSGATVGDSISNVARSVLGVPAMRQAHIQSQMMAPFAQAGQVAALQNASDTHAMHQAQTADYNAQAALRNRPAVPKYNNIQKDADGNIWGQNESTGQLERVPVAAGASPDFSKSPTDKTPDPLISAQIGPKPVQAQGEPDSAYQSRVAAWGKKGTDLQNAGKTSVGVTIANARNDSRYGTFYDPEKGVVQMHMDDAADKFLTPVKPLDVAAIGSKVSAVKGFENALTNVENSSDVLKDTTRRPLIQAALSSGSSDPGYIRSLIQGTARSNLNPKEIQFVTSVLRAKELSGGIRSFAGGMVGSMGMLDKFIAGSVPSGTDSYDFAKAMINGTRQELSVIKPLIPNLSGQNIADTGINGANPMAPPLPSIPPGMKLQRNARTGQTRVVPQ